MSAMTFKQAERLVVSLESIASDLSAIRERMTEDAKVWEELASSQGRFTATRQKIKS